MPGVLASTQHMHRVSCTHTTLVLCIYSPSVDQVPIHIEHHDRHVTAIEDVNAVMGIHRDRSCLAQPQAVRDLEMLYGWLVDCRVDCISRRRWPNCGGGGGGTWNKRDRDGGGTATAATRAAHSRFLQLLAEGFEAPVAQLASAAAGPGSPLHHHSGIL